MILVFQYLVDGVEKTRKILRRGKALVKTAFIAKSNERNEYGRSVLERHHPFTSSSSDLLQAGLQCNSDVQFLDGAVPEMDADLAIVGEENAAVLHSELLFGIRAPTRLQAFALHSYKIGGESSRRLRFVHDKVSREGATASRRGCASPNRWRAHGA